MYGSTTSTAFTILWDFLILIQLKKRDKKTLEESQHVWGWQGPLVQSGPPGPTPAQAGTPRSGHPQPCPGSFWVSPRRYNLSEQSVPLLHHLHSKEVFSEAFPRGIGLSVENIPFTFCWSSFSSSSRSPSSSDSAPLSLLSAFPFTVLRFGAEFRTLLRSEKTFNEEKVSILKETNTQLPQKYQAAAAEKHFHIKRTINEWQFYFCMLFLNYFNVSLLWFTTECLTTHEWFWGSLLEKDSTLHVTFATKPLTKTIIHTSGTATVTLSLGLIWPFSLNPEITIFIEVPFGAEMLQNCKLWNIPLNYVSNQILWKGNILLISSHSGLNKTW